MDFPEEVLALWNLIKDDDGLESVKPLGLRLVGPFEILAGKTFDDDEELNPHLHHRYFFDPAEFMTVAVGYRHFGYFRDSPKELPTFVCSNASEGYQFRIEGSSLVGVLIKLISKNKEKENLAKFEKGLRAIAEDLDLKIDDAKEVVKQRKKTIAQPLSGLGMVVPYNEKTEVGYRDLGYTPAQFKKLAEKIGNDTANADQQEEFQTTITFADVANDECDHGHPLEIGLNLYCFDYAELQSTSCRLLATTYPLLNRQLFADIVTAHVKNRKRKHLSLLA
eukprot:TRINITY_DN66334_c6_g1_i1.p1 TRINITY_DN66334_c6_g1~~TRINITY_DN66334_c6_g1_i1.p1  ORF type:complete len:327 (+),score=23.07 TRINITY_DN66334_c6_g1_i1:147-983(+)